MKKLASAALIANYVHEGVKRRSPADEPYLMHSVRVMLKAMLDDMDEDFCAACLLHDTDEDVDERSRKYYEDELHARSNKLSAHTLRLVKEVTTPADDTLVGHFAKASARGQLLKLYDREDNLESLLRETGAAPERFLDPDHRATRQLNRYLLETPTLIGLSRQTVRQLADYLLAGKIRIRADILESLLKELVAAYEAIKSNDVTKTDPTS